MLVCDLKKALSEFKNTDRICVSAWFDDGGKVFVPSVMPQPTVHIQGDKRYACIGHFDYSLAHMLIGKTTSAKTVGGVRIIKMRRWA